MKVGDKVVVYDDGKINRPAEGIVMWTSGETAYSILVSFFPWGYTKDSEPSLVVFKKLKDDRGYEGLNPLMELSREYEMDEREYFESEYCLILEDA